MLRVVVLEHLREALGRDPSVEETLAVGLSLDDAIAEAVGAFVANQAEQLERSHQRLAEFLGVLGHELRNPLGTVAVALQLARADATPEELDQAIEAIDHSVGTMTRLLDDMLDVARITRGSLEIRPRPVRLADCVAAALRSTRPLIVQRRHTLEAEPVPADLTIEADPTRIEQVVANLLGNAAKYTGPGGRIALSVEREGDFAAIRVADNGNGIAAGLLPVIFDPFVQAPENVGRGLGIGLALVRTLVERHGGSVRAQSDGPGRGSTFTVLLPLADAAADDDGKPSRAPAGPSRRVLIVDDERSSAEILAALLATAGHEVRVAFDGRSALDEAAAFAPDLVLLDLGLPDLDGVEVARRLRELLPAGATVAALTGFAQDPAGPDEPDFDHYLTKPLAPEALDRLIVAIAERPSPAGSQD